MSDFVTAWSQISPKSVLASSTTVEKTFEAFWDRKDGGPLFTFGSHIVIACYGEIWYLKDKPLCNLQPEHFGPFLNKILMYELHPFWTNYQLNFHIHICLIKGIPTLFNENGIFCTFSAYGHWFERYLGYDCCWKIKVNWTMSKSFKWNKIKYCFKDTVTLRTNAKNNTRNIMHTFKKISMCVCLTVLLVFSGKHAMNR